uniref:GH18 domain-containing protein n=1 Tax=Kalanchoe fedtschenkoi TaxID=63787 RepID=A0A7N0UZE7_KALFE
MGASIERCQLLGVKVLLSIGGGIGNYSLNSPADALNVSLYLWESFLGGAARFRPLGNVSLDGVNFDIQSSAASSPYWLDLAARLSSYSAQGTKVYLAASPQCPFPDSALGSALNSSYFDFIWVQFYGNPSCQYSPGKVTNLVSSWGKWTSLRNNATIFLGLPASPFAAPSGGYIPPDVLTAQIIPYIKPVGRYGGLALWSRYYDNGYSTAVITQAPNTTDTTVSLTSKFHLLCILLYIL